MRRENNCLVWEIWLATAALSPVSLNNNEPSMPIDWNLIYSILTVAALLLNGGMGAYVLLKNSKNRLNVQYCAFAASFVIWSLSDFIELAARNAQDALPAIYVGVLGWSLAGPAFLHFILILTGKKDILKRKITYFWLYFPSAVFIGLTWFTDLIIAKDFQKLYFGYWEISGPLYFLGTIYITSAFAVGIFINWKFLRRTANPNARKQLKDLTVAALLSLGIGAITSGVLPLAGVYLFAPTTIFMTPFIIFVGRAIVKYGFLSVTPQLAAETIVKTIPDMLLVLDGDLNISFANDSALAALGYGREDLESKPFGTVVSPRDAEKIMPLLKKSSLKNYEAGYLTKAGERIPVSLSSRPVRGDNESAGIVGVVTVGRDVREINLYIERLRGAESSLKAKNEAVEKINKELQERYSDIERFNKLMVDRELRMVELKDELEKSRKADGEN
jgi:PAS domain S-box-containing protein